MPNLVLQIFVDMLTTMSNRIRKQKRSCYFKTEQTNSLLTILLSRPEKMPSYLNCSDREIQTYMVSELDSSHYNKYIQVYRSDYNVFGLSLQFIRKIGLQHSKLEAELKQAEKEAKMKSDRVLHFRKQKKLWYKKMIHTVSKDLFNIEELERIEVEKRV